MTRNMLITGADSYIGTSFEAYLNSFPGAYRVATLDMRGDAWRSFDFSGFDSVFHVAGIAHTSTRKLDVRQKAAYWAVNALLPVEVARKARDAGAGQFIFLSSMSVYGEQGSIRHPVTLTPGSVPGPRDLYGQSKLAAEEGLQALATGGFRVAILRPPMVYGPGCKGNYPALARLARRAPLFPDSGNRRSMLFVGNLCAHVRHLVDLGAGGLFLPRDKEPVNTAALAWEIARAHGKNLRLTRFFGPLLRLLSGRIGLVDKVLGTLVYEGDDGLSGGEPAGLVDFETSIRMTEAAG